MAIVMLGKLLDRGQDAEIHLEANYSKIRDRSADNGVRLLTYYLARHRHHQQKALDRLDPDMRRRLRKVKLKFNAPFDPTAELRPPDFAPESVNGIMLIEAAVSHDSKLVALYRSILAQPIGDDVREALESLIRVEERDIVILNKMLAMHYF